MRRYFLNFYELPFLCVLDYLFTLKFTAKQLSRQSVRAEKEEKKEKLKLKKVRRMSILESLVELSFPVLGVAACWRSTFSFANSGEQRRLPANGAYIWRCNSRI